MASKRLFPRRGTVIPEHHRPPGSTNAELHELPAYREHTHDLIGVVLYLPRQRHVVVPFQHHRGSAGCIIIEGDDTYPRGGHNVDVSDWELQRAERVVLSNNAIGRHDYWRVRPCASGIRVRTLVEDEIVIEPDVEIRCRSCNKWLSNPDSPVEFEMTPEGPECSDQDACVLQSRWHRARSVYRAPVQP
jgi:hypothetical protein